MALACNACWSNLGRGIVYRTNCRHFFCANCAKQNFENCDQCPVCYSKLKKGDVSEIVIGAAPSPQLDAALQAALQEPSWPAALKHSIQVHAVAAEASCVLLTQALVHCSREEHRANELQLQLQERDATWAEHAKALKGDVDAALLQSVQARDVAAERAVQLQECDQQLQEQVRRCQAWERAYNALREQLRGESGPHAGGRINAGGTGTGTGIGTGTGTGAGDGGAAAGTGRLASPPSHGAASSELSRVGAGAGAGAGAGSDAGYWQGHRQGQGSRTASFAQTRATHENAQAPASAMHMGSLGSYAASAGATSNFSSADGMRSNVVWRPPQETKDGPPQPQSAPASGGAGVRLITYGGGAAAANGNNNGGGSGDGSYWDVRSSLGAMPGGGVGLASGSINYDSPPAELVRRGSGSGSGAAAAGRGGFVSVQPVAPMAPRRMPGNRPVYAPAPALAPAPGHSAFFSS